MCRKDACSSHAPDAGIRVTDPRRRCRHSPGLPVRKPFSCPHWLDLSRPQVVLNMSSACLEVLSTDLDRLAAELPHGTAAHQQRRKARRMLHSRSPAPFCSALCCLSTIACGGFASLFAV